MRSFYLHAESARQIGSVSGVVEMTVGDEDFFYRDTLAFDGGENAFNVAAGVDNSTLHGLFVPDQGAVLLKRGDGDNLKFHFRSGAYRGKAGGRTLTPALSLRERELLAPNDINRMALARVVLVRPE